LLYLQAVLAAIHELESIRTTYFVDRLQYL
jgi:hypothetical protein